MTVAVVTAWHNHLELADDYMEAIQAGPEPDELIIVDNGSSIPLPFARFRLDQNTGFCRGSNAGLAAADSDIVVFLNNDIKLGEPGWLEELTRAVEQGVLAGPVRSGPHARVGRRDMPYIDGWALAGLRDDLFELGGFDETLEEPAYYSDNLLCLEARACDMKLRNVHVKLTHKGGQTTGPIVGRPLEVTVRNHARYLERARELLSVPV